MSDHITYDDHSGSDLHPGDLDDLFLTGVDVHIERLDDRTAHVRITRGGRAVAFDARTDSGRLRLFMLEDDFPELEAS